MCQRERERCRVNWVLACLPGDAPLDQHKPWTNWSEQGWSEYHIRRLLSSRLCRRFESANHTEVSCLAIGQWKSNSVPPYTRREEKKCVDVDTSDSSMLAPDRKDWTSGDQCQVRCAAGFTCSASTLTCTLDVVNGSVSLIGILPNCPGLACRGPPSTVSHAQTQSLRSLAPPIARTAMQRFLGPRLPLD